jgi:uncharacterized protein RhaS with RHS repeats
MAPFRKRFAAPNPQNRFFPSVRYEYDGGGRMIQAMDSAGHVDSYSYDEKGEMLTAAHGTEKPFLTNAKFSDSYIKKQTPEKGRKCK